MSWVVVVAQTGYLRDLSMFIAIFGFFAAVWFLWGRDSPPPPWRRWLTLGLVTGLVVAAGGGLLAWRNWHSPSALDAPAAFRFYSITVAVEFWVAVAGAVVLAVRRQRRWIPVWVCAVVGVHLIPLAMVFQDLLLVVLGVALVGVAVAAALAHRRTEVEPGAATGALAGAALLLAAAVHGVLVLTG